MDLEKYAQALPLLEEALAIRNATLPAGHFEIGESLNNLAHSSIAAKATMRGSTVGSDARGRRCRLQTPESPYASKTWQYSTATKARSRKRCSYSRKPW